MKHVIRIMTHLIFCSMFMLLFTGAVQRKSEILGYALLTMVLNLVLYGLRNGAKSFWWFLSGHVGLAVAGVTMMIYMKSYTWYICVWCMWIIYSVILRLVPSAEILEEPRKVYVVLLVAEYFGLWLLESPRFARTLVVLSVLLVIMLYLLYNNLQSMDRFIYVGSFSNQIDAIGIRKLNQRLSLMYIGGMGAILGIFSLFRMDKVWDTISGWIFRFLRFLVQFIPTWEYVPTEEKKEIGQSMTSIFDAFGPVREVSATSRLLGEILCGIVIFVLAIGVIASIVSGAICLYRYFYSRKKLEEDDRVVEALSLGDEVQKQKKKKFFERFDRNPAKRIRKRYKKSFKQTDTKYLSRLKYLSPNEQVEFLREQGLDETAVMEIQSLYEKARYSTEPVTEADVERMRTILQ